VGVKIEYMDTTNVDHNDVIDAKILCEKFVEVIGSSVYWGPTIDFPMYSIYSIYIKYMGKPILGPQ
jgi:hypothetical protein